MNNELTPIETSKLENLEIVIEGGIRAAFDVWRAFVQIRDQKLYRSTHATFEAYCQERWDMTAQHAHRLAAAGDTLEALEPVGSILPTAETQVRPLTRLPKEERASAWKEAVEVSNGKPTAAVVERVVASRLPESNGQPDDDEPAKPAAKEENAREREAREFLEQFAANVAKVSDGGVYTLEALSKATGIGATSIQWFVRMCEVSPSVAVHRTFGRKGILQYSFVKTECVAAHSRIRQLAEQIASDTAIAGSRAQAAAQRILVLLGG